jgi:hypothetical protein
MAKFRQMTLGFLVILIAGSLIAPVSASELSAAEQRYSELQQKFDTAQGSLLLLIPGYEADAKLCVDRLAGSTSAADISARTVCQQDLTRLKLERTTLEKEIDAIKIELSALELKIQNLKSASSNNIGTGTSNSAVASAGTPESSSSASAGSTPTTQESGPPQTVAKDQEPESAAPLPKSTPSPTTSQKPSSVSQGLPSTTAKPTLSPKPTVKKRTIICVKGKTTRKVTALKPVCPKGFKLKKK